MGKEPHCSVCGESKEGLLKVNDRCFIINEGEYICADCCFSCSAYDDGECTEDALIWGEEL